MESKRGSGTKDELSNQQVQPQDHITTSSEVCCCRGATNLMDVKCAPALKHLIRSCVREEFSCFREEVEELKRLIISSLASYGQPSTSRSLRLPRESSVSRGLQLQFAGTWPDTLLTLTNIQHEGASLKVELYDSSGFRVEDGPESSAKFKIVVINGDFEVEDMDEWTEEEFLRYVVQPRNGRRPLLVGECEISLSKGVAEVGNISFTDNSKWMRSGNFRMGAQVVKVLPSGVVIKPAVSKAFKVKERRLLAQRKHKSPSLEDEVWRLDNIAKNGAICQRLAKEKIYTVKNMLQLYNTDAKKLQKILGVPEKKWLQIIKNAESCTLSNEYYRYYDGKARVELLLDCVFKIVTVTFEGQIDQLYQMLDDSQKELVNKLRFLAYEELEKTYTSTDQEVVHAMSLCPSTIKDTNMMCLGASPNERRSKLQKFRPTTNQICMQAEFASPTPHSLNSSTNGKQSEQQEIHMPTNQKSMQVKSTCVSSIIDSPAQNLDPKLRGSFVPTNQISLHAHCVSPSSTTCSNMQCLDVRTKDQGELGWLVNMNLLSPTPFSFNDDCQLEALLSQTCDSNISNCIYECGLTPLLEEGSTAFEASLKDRVTIKLKAACYVTKAATRFMISVQEDHTAPRKKQKLV